MKDTLFIEKLNRTLKIDQKRWTIFDAYRVAKKGFFIKKTKNSCSNREIIHNFALLIMRERSEYITA